ncbi:MAG TPA: hypothetical protein VN369_06280, partial [Terriglobales bacterium]|nr:hypothetical protein [Terriglobales bacterium]
MDEAVASAGVGVMPVRACCPGRSTASKAAKRFLGISALGLSEKVKGFCGGGSLSSPRRRACPVGVTGAGAFSCGCGAGWLWRWLWAAFAAASTLSFPEWRMMPPPLLFVVVCGCKTTGCTGAGCTGCAGFFCAGCMSFAALAFSSDHFAKASCSFF